MGFTDNEILGYTYHILRKPLVNLARLMVFQRLFVDGKEIRACVEYVQYYRHASCMACNPKFIDHG